MNVKWLNLVWLLRKLPCKLAPMSIQTFWIALTTFHKERNGSRGGEETASLILAFEMFQRVQKNKYKRKSNGKQQMQSHGLCLRITGIAVAVAITTIATIANAHTIKRYTHICLVPDKCDKFSYGTLNTIMAVCTVLHTHTLSTLSLSDYVREIRNCDNI